MLDVPTAQFQPDPISPVLDKKLYIEEHVSPAANNGPTTVPGSYPALTLPQYVYQTPLCTAVGVGVTGVGVTGVGVTGVGVTGVGVTGVGVTGVGVTPQFAADIEGVLDVPTAQFQPDPISPVLDKKLYIEEHVSPAANNGPTTVPGSYPALTLPQYVYQTPLCTAVGVGVTGVGVTGVGVTGVGVTGVGVTGVGVTGVGVTGVGVTGVGVTGVGATGVGATGVGVGATGVGATGVGVGVATPSYMSPYKIQLFVATFTRVPLLYLPSKNNCEFLLLIVTPDAGTKVVLAEPNSIK